MNCKICEDEGWICEQHQNKPFPHRKTFNLIECAGPGMPCVCNKSNPPWNFIPIIKLEV